MLAQNSEKQQISINIENQQIKYINRDGKKEITSFPYTADTIKNEIDIESLKRKIKSITQYQKPYISKLFREVLDKNLENAKIICEYIIAEQNEFNIKESTKEDKIKRLFQLSRFFNHTKSFFEINREDILDFLNSLKTFPFRCKS